jgi:hypothetical protein
MLHALPARFREGGERFLEAFRGGDFAIGQIARLFIASWFSGATTRRRTWRSLPARLRPFPGGIFTAGQRIHGGQPASSFMTNSMSFTGA